MDRCTSPILEFRRFAAVAILMSLAAAPAFAAGVPVVAAIDTSRSLSPAELEAMTAELTDIVAGLDPAPPLGLMAFDDAPHWIVEPPSSLDAVVGGLVSLRPAGDFTLLNDALFTAARALSDGGVILLLTDGRDENSATTVDDVAAICRDHHVRIVALSTGRQVDEKALRRLALLTEGAYLGPARTVAGMDVAAAVTEAGQRSAAEVEAMREAEETRSAGPIEPVPASPARAGAGPSPTEVAPWWLLPLLLVLIAAVLATLLVLWRWRKSVVEQQPPASEPTGDWETDPAIPAVSPPPPTDAAREPTVDLPPSPPVDDLADELVLDPSAFERLPFDGNIDATSVLDEQHILSVMEPGREIRSFRLRADRAFAVGRAPGVNTLTLSSRAMSGQHFKIVPHDEGFAIVDLASTNGTLVNGRKIRAHHLEPGDKIRAGDIEFEFKVILKSLN